MQPSPIAKKTIVRVVVGVLVVAAVAAAVVRALSGASRLGGDGEARRPRVSGIVVVCVDTLRADALEPDERGASPMPLLDAFGSGGARFRGCIAPSSWTGPSLATALTGLIPLRHGLTDSTDRARLPAGVPTLASILRAAGWSTWASTGGGWAGAGAGMDLGFDRFGEDFDEHAPADTIAKWSESRAKDRPFLLLLHTYFAHDPYGDRLALAEKRCAADVVADAKAVAARLKAAPSADDPPLRRDFVRLWLSSPCGRRALEEAYGKQKCWDTWQGCLPWMNGGWREDAEDRALVTRLGIAYRENLSHADRRVAQALDAIAAAVSLKDTAVVVFGDHGEAFGEHGVVYHGSRLTEELARVPLLLRGPGFPAGSVVDASCGLVDLLPTLLDLAAVAPPRDLDGRNLLALVEGSGRGSPGGKPAGWPVESFVRPHSETPGADDDTPRWVSVRSATATWLASFDARTSTWPSETWFDRRADLHEQSPLKALPPGVGDAPFEDAVRKARSRVAERYGRR